MMDGMVEKRLLERRSVDFNPLNVGARSRKSMALLTVLDIGLRRRIHPCRSRAVAHRSVHQAIQGRAAPAGNAAADGKASLFLSEMDEWLSKYKPGTLRVQAGRNVHRDDDSADDLVQRQG
ncbi:MAG: hypothetical protein E5W72_09270 [Mesorhizobium sp.]|uniref:hypothetical protein n=1 Tax=Mesorhizobium sp. TaxID=1871066 RepID=UPI0011FD2D22|nr:hypothetical protein [Mesorhizobium sp.]TIT02693.1 MAG: hypothetical protein E5W87_08870 [Mesorhizobium sp.]TIT52432.1 MAG: hypothetical protein E5W72_09270 [Mesorhizobium sp.]